MEGKQVQNFDGSSSEAQFQYAALIIEDDLPTCEILAACLREVGLIVVAVATLEAARREIRQDCPHLVVLDLGLPDGHGMMLARELRTDHPDVGILVVTAQVETMDAVLGLNLGADDYVRKPFAPLEVAARAQAILRRVHTPQPVPSQRGIKLGRWRLNIPRHQVINKNGRAIDLTRAEFDLLTYLVRSSGRVRSREPVWR